MSFEGNLTEREKQILLTLDIRAQDYCDKIILREVILQRYKSYVDTRRIQSNTVVDIEVDNSDSIVEHEAVTGKISEQILYYLMSRGLDEDKAVAMFISGYFKEVFVNLPFEFAVEAKKLVEMKVEGL
jgi:SUF system FeS cluster assembly, SufBD